MSDYFIGTIKRNGTATIKEMPEEFVILETEPGGIKAKVIFANSDTISIGEIFYVSEVEPNPPKPKYSAFKDMSKV